MSSPVLQDQISAAARANGAPQDQTVRSPAIARASRDAFTGSSRHAAQPVVALFGEWDTENLGDRAIHREAVRFFSESGWHVRSYGLGSLQPVEDDAARDDAIHRPSVPGRIARGLGPGPRRVLRGIRQRYRVRQLVSELERVHAISIGGGALLSDRNLHFPQSLSVLAGAARRLGVPLLCLGCGTEGGWSATGRRKIRDALDHAAVIAVRDESTAARIEGLLGRPVGVFGDFCLTEGLAASAGRRGNSRPAWAINVARIAEPWSALQQHYEDALVSLVEECRECASRNGLTTVRIFTTGTPGDRVPAQRVFSRLGGAPAELHIPTRLEQLTGLLRTCGLVFATRLHAAVLALAEGTPVIASSPAPKLHEFFATVGLARFSADLAWAATLECWHREGAYDAIFEDQLQRISASRVWAERTRVRRMLTATAEDHAIRGTSGCA